MAVIAKAEITISKIASVEKITRYYLLQSSTAAVPSKPADGSAISSNWSKTEPSYTSGSTNTLYFVDQTILSDSTIKYSEVSKSSSYEAAKEAWNKANNAQNTADSANDKIDGLQVGGRNLARQTAKAKTWTSSSTYAWDTWIGSDGGSGWLPSILIEPEQTYTLSFDYVIEDCTDKSIGVGIGAGTTGSDYAADTWEKMASFKQYGGNIESGHFVYNLSAKSPSQLGNEKYFAFRPARRLGDNVLTTPIKLTISNFKLEKGNKATDWTPAPEDYYTKTETDASIQVLSDKISQQVSTTDKLGTRLSKVEQDSGSWSVTLETANAAKSAADKASQTASSASSTASAAKLTADNANKTASSAMSTASNAQKTAENAASTASSASSTATEAKNTADAANKTASNANSTASEAKKTADSANTTAGQAKSTADNASQTASSAKSAADKANENASSAVSTANAAKSTSDTAKSTADTARQEASDAAKTATNFMGFDLNGLVVGDRTANTLGKNVLIGNDEIDIRNGTTNYARFAETLIELGLTKDFVLQILNKAIRFIGKDNETAIAHIGYGDCLANNDDDDGNLVTRNQPYYTFGERRPYYKTQNGNGRAALIGEYSCAEGFMTIAEGPYSHVEGIACCVEQVMAAHAEGYGTYANGDYAHTEGLNTAASGSASHAEGSGSLARGYVSHAEGENTQATGEHSHASGCETIASGNEQTVIGRYNTDDASQLFIIGNGSANDARKNAFTVSETGDITSTGNTVQLIKNGNLVASYDGTTPVLLSTAVYPNADYTGIFSAPASTQPHGILIEFAPYADGQAKGYGLVTFFIPKGRCNGESYNIYIDPWCSKWIYVYDDKIVGNDANSKTGTTNGISYNNRKYVLSRVYGV